MVKNRPDLMLSDMQHSSKLIKYPLFRQSILVVFLLSTVLTGCHFPQPTAAPLGEDDQRQTEIAGILNPSTSGQPETTPVLTPLPPLSNIQSAPPLYTDGIIIYTTQQGDTLPALARRFGLTNSALITAQVPLPADGLIPPGVPIEIPDLLPLTLPYHAAIFPDSEVVYGPGVGQFNAADYARQSNGFLATYSEFVKDQNLSGPEIVQRVAIETSTNPRLLLSFLEYQSGWVLGHPQEAARDAYPIGYGAEADTGLYKELMITAKLLAQGFYGWRDGSRLELNFFGGGTGRLSPALNAGSTAIMHLFATLMPQAAWESHLFGAESFFELHQAMFGDYWARAASVQPYLLESTRQPDLVLPFAVGEAWSLTGGPHITWQTGTPRGAIDFAPITGEPHCAVSTRWVTASAPGLVVRSDRSVVALDLDGDGDEGTGWVLIYQHIAEQDRVTTGTWLAQDAPLGHPSCEGGQASGTHVHFARKFNGEWVGVDGPLQLVLSGWVAIAEEGRYGGYLQKGERVVTYRPNGAFGSTIIRED